VKRLNAVPFKCGIVKVTLRNKSKTPRRRSAGVLTDRSGHGLLRKAALLLLLSLFADISQSPAQQRTAIETAPVLSLSPNIEAAFPVRIAEGADLPKRATLLIQGIPATLTLTQGRVFDSGVWFVPIADLPKLTIIATSEATGLQKPLTLTLVALDGTVLAEGRTTLAVGPAPGALDAKATAATQAPAGSDARPNPGISPAEEAERLKIGQAALTLNDIAAARLVFEHLANRGSAAGAWHLAQTYDPQVLARTTVGAHFKPDEAVAARWYARAAEMGHAEARRKVAGNR
jgi:hypothetical protein